MNTKVLPVRQELLDVLPNEGIILVAGGIGSGKSCLAYGLMESLHSITPDRKYCTFGLPLQKASLLPDWLSTSLELEFPDDSVVLVDEAYIQFYSRNSQSARNKFMDTFSGLARQKGILALYITQSTRKLDISLVSGAQALLVKRPDVLQIKFDRSELRSTLATALSQFEQAFRIEEIVKDKKYPHIHTMVYKWLSSYRAATYIVAQQYDKLMEDTNTPPSFWSDGLSRAWKGVSLQKDGVVVSTQVPYLCGECSEKAAFVCLCHQNSYCDAHGDGHERA